MVKFVEYDNYYLDKSFDWLNDSEIKQLVNAPDISKDSQKKWFSSLKLQKDYYIWGIEYDENPIGVVGLKHVDIKKGEGEYFGYIGEKEYWGRGIGVEMISFIQNFADNIGLERLYLYVVKNNYRAIKLYKKCGYTRECVDAINVKMIKSIPR